MKSVYHQSIRVNSLKGLKWAIIIAIFFFLGKMVWDHWNEVKGIPMTLRPVPFVLSTVIFAFSYFIQIWAWYLITLKLNIALSPSETLKTWFYSQLGKYLPGKVWLLLGRFYLYEAKGRSKRLISTALYYEMVTIIFAGGIIFLVSLFLFQEKSPIFRGDQVGWIIFLLLIVLLFLHPRFLEKIMNWFLVRFKRETVTLSISYPDILWILLICGLAWLIGGIGFYLFVDSLYPVPLKHFLFFTGVLAVSNTLGLIVFFVPAGLGVREGVLVYLLSSLIPSPIAVILSVTTRLWMTLIEIGLIGVVYFGGKVWSRLMRQTLHV